MGQELAGLRSWASWQDRTLGSTTWGVTTSLPTSRRTPFHSPLLSDHFLRQCFCSLPQASSPKASTKEMFSKGWAISAISHLPRLPVLWTKDKLFPQPLPELSSHLSFHLQTMIIKSDYTKPKNEEACSNQNLALQVSWVSPTHHPCHQGHFGICQILQGTVGQSLGVLLK